jgi:hypothetical protein
VIHLNLTSAEWTACVDAVSSDRRFWYTRRNLFHEALRHAQLGPKAIHPDADFGAFCANLDWHERASGLLPKLIRPDAVPDEVDTATLDPDALEHTVRRVLVFDRIDTLLLFAKNGFHRTVEVGLVLHGAAGGKSSAGRGFPRHVWTSLLGQLRSGLETTFYTVHDCTASGYAMAQRLRSALADHGRSQVADVGLTFPQVFELGAEVQRSTVPGGPVSASLALDPEEEALLVDGNYLHLEQLRPLEAMRWVYERVARRRDDAALG